MADFLENVDISVIKGHDWANELRSSLLSLTDKCILNWCQLVIQLGVNELELEKWIDIFRQEIEETYKSLVMDVIDTKAKVVNNITQMLSKIQSCSHVLGLKEDLQDINPDQKYYQLQKELMTKYSTLEKLMEEKKQELDSLLEKQNKLCKTLGQPPYELSPSEFPSVKELENLQKYVEKLEQEKFVREERFVNLKELISKMATELELSPKSELERNILTDTLTGIDITDENMDNLKKYHDDLVLQVKNMKEEIDHLRQTVDDLWTVLEESMTERDNFHDRNPGYSINTLKALRIEVKRCEQLKKANIKIFVEKLRTKLYSLWEKCYHQHQGELDNYPWLTSDLYTEDLLFYHEREITKWQNFYSRNEELIRLFTEHKKYWDSLLEMENKDSDGLNRYKNRGGQLLKEEKVRNKLLKKIPSIEEKIKSLAAEYEQLHGTSFLIFGVPILDYISNLYCKRDQDRKSKLSARKLTREQVTVTPGKSCLSLFSSTSRLCLTPHPTSALRKKLFSPKTGSEKPKTVKKNILSIQDSNLRRAKRLSQERKKRLSKCKKVLALKTAAENKEEFSNITNYDTFEQKLSARDDNSRSTLNFLDRNSRLKIIPAIIIEAATPRK